MTEIISIMDSTQKKSKGKPYTSEKEKFLLSLVQKELRIVENKKTDAQNNE